MSLIFSAADMLPKIRLFEYQEESMKGETIAAISTAVSSSGIGIVRISGDQAFEIADRVYRSPNYQNSNPIRFTMVISVTETKCWMRCL